MPLGKAIDPFDFAQGRLSIVRDGRVRYCLHQIAAYRMSNIYRAKGRRGSILHFQLRVNVLQMFSYRARAEIQDFPDHPVGFALRQWQVRERRRSSNKQLANQRESTDSRWLARDDHPVEPRLFHLRRGRFGLFSFTRKGVTAFSVMAADENRAPAKPERRMASQPPPLSKKFWKTFVEKAAIRSLFRLQ